MSDAFTAAEKKTFDTFDQYPWDADAVFQAGLDNILSNLAPNTTDDDNAANDEDRQLLRAKHFFFSRFNQAFDLDQYIRYKQLQTQEQPAASAHSDREARYRQLEQYDYDHDDAYLDGLSEVVQGWVKQQTQQAVIWDKARLDDEFKKAKAQYYAAHVDPSVDLAGYFAWVKEKKAADQPACPFAHLWQNKHSGKQPATSSARNDGSAFVASSSSRARGATTLTLSSPGTNNILTVARLAAFTEALARSERDETATAHMLNALVATNDGGAVVSSGLAYAETCDMATKAARVASLAKLTQSYYEAVEQTVLSLTKPCVTFLDGAVPANAGYLFLWHRFTRVITEHAVLPLGLALSHAPAPPLLLLTLCRSRKPTLSQGLEMYLALAPPELVRLRGPELLKLGLADAFVPAAQFHDVFETVKKMSLCPPPTTTTAIQLGLATAHTYPGPDRLAVWETEIQRVFGTADTLGDIRSMLEQVDNKWSKTILDHWSTLPPTLLKAVFHAVKSCRDMEPAKTFALEQSLNAQWRQSDDYVMWCAMEEEENKGRPVVWMDEDEYPEVSDGGAQADAVVYEAPEESNTVDVAVCPVTGQRSAASGVCPVTGQTSQAAVCPVNGDQHGDATAATRCPVTGQQGTTCPASS